MSHFYYFRILSPFAPAKPKIIDLPRYKSLVGTTRPLSFNKLLKWAVMMKVGNDHAESAAKVQPPPSHSTWAPIIWLTKPNSIKHWKLRKENDKCRDEKA